MAQQANITAYDGATTPVVHTLVGEGIEKAPNGAYVASWKETLPSVPDKAQVRFKTSKRRLPTGVIVVSELVEVPIMETVSGQNASGYTAAPKVAHVPTIEIIGKFHERSTELERRLVRQLALNLAGNIATSVAAATSGFVPDLIDKLVVPT